MRKHHRTVMLLIVAALLFAMASSAMRSCVDINHNYACADSDRDCICECCPICINAHLKENLQRAISFDAAAYTLASFLVLGFVCDALPENEVSSQNTPISLKVKLLN